VKRIILRRAAQLVPVLLVMTILIFSMIQLLPGDPTTAVVGLEATEEQRERVRVELGLDQPLPVQYLRWLGRLASGDFGRSLRTNEPVSDMLLRRAPVTFQLTLMSILLAVGLGVPLGIVAAVRRNTWIDVVASLTAMFSLAIPYFWAGILLIMLFSVHLKLLPPSGYVPFLESPGQNLRLMLLPTLTIGTAMAALVMRQTRTSMLAVLSEDYIRTARAKGLSGFAVVVRHGLRNALIPVVTVVGLQFGTLIGGAVVTEAVFSLPGLGRMIVDGIFWRDFTVVQGGIFIVVLGVVLVNLVTDLSYALLDRRIRL
jgi:peptide/nickel transport system permease protein